MNENGSEIFRPAEPGQVVNVNVPVTITPEMAAQAFAQMGSDDQAEFLAKTFELMAKFEYDDGRCMGSHGRQTQLYSIRGWFDEYPQAQEFIEELHEMTAVEDKPEGFVFPVHREPSLAELHTAKNYIDEKLRETRGECPECEHSNGRHCPTCPEAGPRDKPDNGDWPDSEQLPTEETEDVEDALHKQSMAAAEEREAQIAEMHTNLVGVVSMDYEFYSQRYETALGSIGREMIRQPPRMIATIQKPPEGHISAAGHYYHGGTRIGSVIDLCSDGKVRVALEKAPLELSMASVHIDGEVRFTEPVDCPDCQGKGFIELWSSVDSCDRCDGRGKV